MSLPAWGGWIEIPSLENLSKRPMRSLPAWGGWIEIVVCSTVQCPPVRPSPHGEGGLKSSPWAAGASPMQVPPRMGRVD